MTYVICNVFNGKTSTEKWTNIGKTVNKEETTKHKDVYLGQYLGINDGVLTLSKVVDLTDFEGNISEICENYKLVATELLPYINDENIVPMMMIPITNVFNILQLSHESETLVDNYIMDVIRARSKSREAE